MEPSEIARQTLQFSKVTFDNTFRGMLLLQDQSERNIDIYLNRMVAFHQEGKRIADTWMEAWTTSSECFKKALENNYAISASFLYDAEKKSKN